jgi:hypothetical protein
MYKLTIRCRSIDPNQATTTPPGKVETLSQTLTGLDPDSSLYGLTFYYLASVENAPCTLTVDLGTTNILMRVLNPASPKMANGNYVYTPATVDFITPPSQTADLVFGFICIDGAVKGSRIQLDDAAFTAGKFA